MAGIKTKKKQFCIYYTTDAPGCLVAGRSQQISEAKIWLYYRPLAGLIYMVMPQAQGSTRDYCQWSTSEAAYWGLIFSDWGIVRTCHCWLLVCRIINFYIHKLFLVMKVHALLHNDNNIQWYYYLHGNMCFNDWSLLWRFGPLSIRVIQDIVVEDLTSTLNSFTSDRGNTLLDKVLLATHFT